MRHVLGILGVVAAGILLAVSAAMNYRFGFSLGKTAIDGQIYGLASAAADCFKALVPFFFFAALRNRMWSQALAAAAPTPNARRNNWVGFPSIARPTRCKVISTVSRASGPGPIRPAAPT